jgi:hypothetical protein
LCLLVPSCKAQTQSYAGYLEGRGRVASKNMKLELSTKSSPVQGARRRPMVSAYKRNAVVLRNIQEKRRSETQKANSSVPAYPLFRIYFRIGNAWYFLPSICNRSPIPRSFRALKPINRASVAQLKP